VSKLHEPHLFRGTGTPRMVVAGSDQSNAQKAEAAPAYKKVRRKKSERFANGALSLHRRFRNLGVFFLAKHSSGRRIDQVNTFADRARHNLIGTIGSSYAGVTLHAEPSVRAAV
jgi:hypothetical protein